MGTSKRYAHSIDAAMDARIADGIMRTGQPHTLTAQQLDLEHEPLTRSPAPSPARAWVEYGDHAIEVDVLVTAWTERAVAVKWDGPDGAEHRAWVWAGAVSQRRRRERSG